MQIFHRSEVGQFRFGKKISPFPVGKKSKGSETDHIISVPVSEIVRGGPIKFGANKSVEIPDEICDIITNYIGEIAYTLNATDMTNVPNAPNAPVYIIRPEIFSRTKGVEVSPFNIN